MMLRLASRKAKEIPDKRVVWTWDFAKILLDSMLTALENQRVPGPLWQDTILIQADRVHTLQLSISREDKEYLFRRGYDQARRSGSEADDPCFQAAPRHLSFTAQARLC